MSAVPTGLTRNRIGSRDFVPGYLISPLRGWVEMPSTSTLSETTSLEIDNGLFFDEADSSRLKPLGMTNCIRTAWDS